VYDINLLLAVRTKGDGTISTAPLAKGPDGIAVAKWPQGDKSTGHVTNLMVELVTNPPARKKPAAASNKAVAAAKKAAAEAALDEDDEEESGPEAVEESEPEAGEVDEPEAPGGAEAAAPPQKKRKAEVQDYTCIY